MNNGILSASGYHTEDLYNPLENYMSIELRPISSGQPLPAGDLNNFSSAIKTGSWAQNLTAEPGFLSTAAGQQMLLKGGLMLAQMVMGAIDKPKQTKPQRLNEKKVAKIKKKKKEEHGLA